MNSPVKMPEIASLGAPFIDQVTTTMAAAGTSYPVEYVAQTKPFMVTNLAVSLYDDSGAILYSTVARPIVEVEIQTKQSSSHVFTQRRTDIWALERLSATEKWPGWLFSPRREYEFKFQYTTPASLAVPDGSIVVQLAMHGYLVGKTDLYDRDMYNEPY